MTTAEKLVKIAENEQKVYEAGQKSMVDESKIIEKTVSGSVIVVDDVSEVPHEVSVQLSSDTVTDFSGVAVKVYGEDFWRFDSSYSVDGNGTQKVFFDVRDFTLPLGVYTFICDAEVENLNMSSNGNALYLGVVRADGTSNYYMVIGNGSISGRITSTVDVSISPITRFILTTHERFTSGSIRLENICLVASEFVTYPSNADGKVNIKSISPYMTMVTDNNDVNISATYHKSWGMQTEYDRFWDVFQQNGNRTDYNTAFRGVGWTADTFKPKYDIIPVGNTNSMFVVSSINADLVELLEKQVVVLDFSKVTMLGSGFQNSKFTRIGTIDCSSFTATGTTSLFSGCTALKVIDKIVINENIALTSWFNSCSALEEILFEGVIGNSLDIRWSTKLSAESYQNIIFHLSSTATGVKLTVPTNAPTVYDAKYGSGAWKRDTDNNINIKGWSFAYA